MEFTLLQNRLDPAIDGMTDNIEEVNIYMPNAKNIAQTEIIAQKFAKAKSIILTGYAGLSVKQQTKLRAVLRSAGGEFLVAKNTLVARILQKEELNQSLKGQTGILFAYEDEVKPLKELVKFSEVENLPEIRAGLVEGKIFTHDEVIALSKIPGKEELISKMLGSLKAPGNNLVSVLKASMRDLVYVLSAIATK